jgi:hypothetical protein
LGNAKVWQMSSLVAQLPKLFDQSRASGWKLAQPNQFFDEKKRIYARNAGALDKS